MKEFINSIRIFLIYRTYKFMVIFERFANKGFALDIFSKKFQKDPYQTYSKMRSINPIYHSKPTFLRWVTKMQLVQQILRDERFSVDDRKYPIAKLRRKELKRDGRDIMLDQFENPSILKLDPPDHSRIRKLVSYGFSNRYIKSLENHIIETIDQCLDHTHNLDSFDLMEVLAKPLPAIVIAKMMGLPDKDLNQFQMWSENLLQEVGGIGSSVKKRKLARDAYEDLIRYFEKIILSRKDNPGDDFIGKLIKAEEEGDKLNVKEMYGTCLLLLIAGHETTTRLIGNGLYSLFNHPEQFNLIRKDYSLIPNAIEEMLRFEPPVHATVRFAYADMEYEGNSYKKGTPFAISIAGANRDPEANENPNEFNILRNKINHVSFGYGPHMCIGASLARIESRLVFEKIFERFPKLRLGDELPKWQKNFIFRGFENLIIKTR